MHHALRFSRAALLKRGLPVLAVLVGFAPLASTSFAEAPAPAPASKVAVQRGTSTALRFSEPVAAEVTFEQLKRMLPPPPIVVGFDVDDTLVFSEPAFTPLQREYPAEVIRPKNLAALTPEQKAKYHEFWNRLNNEYDDRSVPKRIGKKLLDLHLQRGDVIYIISKRQSSVPENDLPTRRLERFFGITLKNPVVQTELKDKTPFIVEHHIQYYYGDADTDVTAALAAGATPIRVKRSSESYSADKVHNGWYDEIVLAGSDW